jgi:adrenodoxin-NADP+ reductase
LALVGWYNGHPAFSHLAPDLSSVRSVSVIGHGNVALDVSRILLKPVEQLRETDMPESVLEVLAASKVERVMATGRRGPAQVAFTTKEFREMIKLPRVHYTGLDQALAEDAKAAVEGDRMRTRLLGLMEKDNGVTAENAKRFQLEFLRSPSAFKGEGGRVKQVEWNVNELLSSSPAPPTPPSSQAESQPKASVVARPTGEKVVTEANMVVESVGYRSEPLGVGEAWVLPFDRARGRVRNVGGRVVDEAGVAVSR